MNRNVLAAVGPSLLFLCFVVGAQNKMELSSLLGRTLYALSDDEGIQAAQKSLLADPANAALAVKLSKAQAGRRQYREAVATCTTALAQNPRSADLYLERGHRELGLREFRQALADLDKAVELDGQQLDAHYHQGMAHYFLREFDGAAQSFSRALALAKTTDSTIDCSNWLYVSHRRAGHREEAAKVLARITPDMKNTEPHLYFYLRLLRFYQGVLPENEVLPAKPSGPADIEGELSYNTINYGVGNWHLYNGDDRVTATNFFQRVVKGSAWNSWGFIGSELELAAATH